MSAADRWLARATAGALCTVATTGAALAAQASAANAATISVDKACYVNTDPASGAPMTITGSGFTPGDTIEIDGGTSFASVTADGNGNFSTAAQAPILSSVGPGTLTTTMTATDNTSTGAVITATASVLSANLAIATKPTEVKNVHKDKSTFTFSGFTPGKDVYGFYMRNKLVAKENFGRATGPCGTLRKKALLFPGGHPKNSKYNVAFESTPQYSKTAFPRVTGVLTLLQL